MNTDTLARPEGRQSSDRQLIHWVCLTQLDNLPLVALCGELPPKQFRKPGRVSCQPCLDLAFTHAAGCVLCAPYTRKYR